MKERPILMNAFSVRAVLDGRKTMTRRVIKPQPEMSGFFAYEKFGFQFYVSVDEPGAIWRCPYGVPGDRHWQSGIPLVDGWYYVDGLSDPDPVWLRRFLPEDYPGEGLEPDLLWGFDEHDDPEAIGLEGLSLETIRWKRPGDRLWVKETWGVGAQFDGCKPSNIMLEMKPGKHPKITYKADDPSLDFHRWRSSRFMPRWASCIALEITGIRVEQVQEIGDGDVIAEGVYDRTGSHVADCHNAGKHFGPDQSCFCGDKTPQEEFAILWDSINAKKGFSFDANPWVWVVEFDRLEKGAERERE